MGQAILTGLLVEYKSQFQIIACVSSDESAARLEEIYGKQIEVIINNNVEGVRKAQVVILCTKPQVAKSVIEEDDVKAALENKLLISILAGVRNNQLQEWLPKSSIIRAMPNTPCKIREGMTILSCSPKVPAEYKAFAKKIFSSIGRCRYLDEKHMDAVTALGGSGPAFGCVVLESLADGGVMMGLPRDIAIELAAQSLQGAARMVLQTSQHPAMVKDSVTTPGGCTIAGLLTMEDGKIRSTLARAIQEATVVASGLGKKQDEKR